MILKWIHGDMCLTKNLDVDLFLKKKLEIG